VTERLPFLPAALAAVLLAVSAGVVQAQPLQNLFISPMGEPFLGPASAPYPVVDWFKKVDKNGDGKIDADEFRADAEVFFKVLDRNHDSVLTSNEIYIYEHQMVPEILNAGISSLPTGLIRVQATVLQSPGDFSQSLPNVSTNPEGTRTNQDDQPRAPLREGAAFFSLFNEPEPVMAADRNFDFKISLQEYLAQADRHFRTLDVKERGYLTLDDLPRTAAETIVHARRAAK